MIYFESIDVNTIYDVPNHMLTEGLDRVALNKLKLKYNKPNLIAWNDFLTKYKNPKESIQIAPLGANVSDIVNLAALAAFKN